MLCSRVQNLLSAYCDSELTGTEMLRLRQHLERCPGCDEEYRAIKTVKTLLGALPLAPPERQLVPDALAEEAAAGGYVRRRVEFLWRQSGLARQVAEQRERWDLFGDRLRHSLRGSWAPLGVGGALAAVTLGFVLLMQPQYPDAVTAHVPEQIYRDDGRFMGRMPVAFASGRGAGQAVALPGERHMHPAVVMFGDQPAAGYVYRYQIQGDPGTLLLIPDRVRFPEVVGGGFSQPGAIYFHPPSPFSGPVSFVTLEEIGGR
jgi:hypothetical protein